MAPARRKPAIALTRPDHDMLTRLANAYAARSPDLAEDISTELDRARIVTERQAATQNMVRIGSSLRFTTDAGEDRTVTLVLPGEADIAENKISVMTPIGVALIGLSAGQSINWTARDGVRHLLTVLSVDNDAVTKLPAL